jgi:hypothetical protein
MTGFAVIGLTPFKIMLPAQALDFFSYVCAHMRLNAHACVHIGLFSF